MIENFPPTNLETKYVWMEKILKKIKIVHPFNRINICKKGSRGHGSFISKFKLQTPNLPYGGSWFMPHEPPIGNYQMIVLRTSTYIPPIKQIHASSVTWFKSL